MRSGWVGLIRAKAETVCSREHRADGSSLTTFRCSSSATLHQRTRDEFNLSDPAFGTKLTSKRFDIGCSGIKTENINIVREFLDRWSRDGNMSENGSKLGSREPFA